MSFTIFSITTETRTSFNFSLVIFHQKSLNFKKGGECRKAPINAIYLAPVKFYIDNGLATLAVLPHCVNTHKQTLSTPLHKAWSWGAHADHMKSTYAKAYQYLT